MSSLIKSLFVLIFLSQISKSYRSSEKYEFFKTHNNLKQIFGGYYLNFSGEVIENISEKKSQKEELIPVDFKKNMLKFESIDQFVFSTAWGNQYPLVEQTHLKNKIPNGGFDIKVYTADESEYQKLIKFLGGVFNLEIATAINYYMKMSDHKKKSFIHNNYPLNSLNTVTFKRILEFLNNGQNFAIPFLIDPMVVFESDYVSFSCEFFRNQHEIKLKFEINIVMREFLVDRLFRNDRFKFLKDVESEFWNKNKYETLKTFGKYITNNDIVSLLKKSEPFFKFKENSPSLLNTIQFNSFLTKNFTPLQNSIKFEIQNISFDKFVFFEAFLIFSNSELPLFRNISNELSKNSFILQRTVSYQQSLLFAENPSTIIKIVGVLKDRGHFNIIVPFQHIHKTFETAKSDVNIQDSIPASFVRFKIIKNKDILNKKDISIDDVILETDEEKSGEAEFFEKQGQNIIYKSKNYDPTIVFAIVSVYLVFIFLLFNAVISLKDKNI